MKNSLPSVTEGEQRWSCGQRGSGDGFPLSQRAVAQAPASCAGLEWMNCSSSYFFSRDLTEKQEVTLLINRLFSNFPYLPGQANPSHPTAAPTKQNLLNFYSVSCVSVLCLHSRGARQHVPGGVCSALQLRPVPHQSFSPQRYKSSEQCELQSAARARNRLSQGRHRRTRRQSRGCRETQLSVATCFAGPERFVTGAALVTAGMNGRISASNLGTG